MTKKLLIGATLIIASATILAGCSLIPTPNSNLIEPQSSAPLDQAAPGDTVVSDQNTPKVTISPAPTVSTSTAVTDLEKDLDNLNLEPEMFQ